MDLDPIAWQRLALLAAGFAPYALISGYDQWLHRHARRVPRLEQALHAGLALAMGAFLTLVARAETRAALAALALFAGLLLLDEFGYHGSIDRHERRVHWLADAALAGFVIGWLWLDGGFG
jgi:hypothetical protein